MRRLTRTLTLIFALFTFAAVIPNAQAAETQQDMSNIIRYIPEKDWNNGQLSDAEKQSKAHTIHWLTGVKPPRMPHEITKRDDPAEGPELGDFVLLEEKNGTGTVTNSYYASPYYPGNGWYDINKYISESGSGKDAHACFAVAMTDMLHWWLDQNRNYVEYYVNQLPPDQQTKKDALTNYLDNNLQDGSQNAPVLQNPATSRLYNDVIFPRYDGASKGGWPDKPADYFFNGYSSDKDKMERNRPEDFPVDGPTAPGGLFYDVFGKSILTDHIGNGRYSALNDNLKNYMDQGIGVVIGFNMMGGSHAIAMWGAEYDETGNLCALYMVDNNDNGTTGIGATIDGKLIAMIRYDVYESPDGPAAYITTRTDRSGNNIVNSYYPLTLARDGWQAWQDSNPHWPKYEDGRAFLNPIQDTISCEHEYSYAAMGAQLIKSCPKCGNTVYIYMDFSSTTERIYNNGQPVKPVVKKSSLGNSYPFDTSDIWYNNNRDVGTATAYMSTTQEGVTYTAKLDFEILPKPMTPPTAAPIPSAVGPYSVFVKTESGLEYSINGQEWRADGKFYGLTPNTTYEVQVRTAAPADNKNYTNSEPFSQKLEVETMDGTALGAPSWRITALENNQVTVQNSGTYATVNLVIAGYDTRGRQNFVRMQEVAGEAGQPVTVSFSGGSAEYRAFLLDEEMRPVTDRAVLPASAVR